MPIQIGQRADHGFDQPLGLLSDCHRRIEHFLGVLVIVDAQVSGAALSAEQRRALEGALTYFEAAAPKHTADEEESLFPRLRASGDPAASEAMALLDALEHDHRAAEADHAAVDMLVRRWLADDRLAAPDVTVLREALARLQRLYQRHIAIEDQQLFPAAARLLSPQQVEEVGREMAGRRQARR